MPDSSFRNECTGTAALAHGAPHYTLLMINMTCWGGDTFFALFALRFRLPLKKGKKKVKNFFIFRGIIECARAAQSAPEPLLCTNAEMLFVQMLKITISALARSVVAFGY